MTLPGAVPGTRPAWWRLPFMAAAMAALLAAVYAGLERLGCPVPIPAAELAAAHGPLMVSGFFGTLIALERAVAWGKPWAYLAPASAGIGGLSILAGAVWPLPPLLFVCAAVLLLLVSAQVIRRQPAIFTVTLAAGAAAWLVGNLLWLSGSALLTVVPWWASFFLLTIAGERLELTRLMPPRPYSRELFVVVATTLVAAATVASLGDARPMGFAWVALATWLITFDIARRTARSTGLPRFTAICLLTGYAWLAAGGAILALFGLEPGTGAYDAALHALFLGFVFAMVFGHAPVIFPAILRRPLPFHPVLYLPLVLLNLSLLLRMAGDGLGSEVARHLGGMGNAVTLVTFLGLAGWLILTGRPLRGR